MPGPLTFQAAEFLYETSLFPELDTRLSTPSRTRSPTAVLLERRRVLHARIVEAIEDVLVRSARGVVPARFWPITTAAVGTRQKAVEYLSLTGQRAVRRSAYAEAVNHLTAASEWLATLPQTRERRQQELVVQMTLGTALRGVKGSSTPEVEQCYLHARALCEQVGEPPQLFQILWGLWMIYNQRGDAQAMRPGRAAPRPGATPRRPGPPASRRTTPCGPPCSPASSCSPPVAPGPGAAAL